jgi:(p)ppGpp synthase/HD superfamily hydrolase
LLTFEVDISSDMSMIAKAIILAAWAHKGQKDKAGAPYILHPLRVMLAMYTESGMTTAILHDVTEDTPLKLSDLTEMGFSEEIVDAVDHLTKRAGEPYDTFIRRVKESAMATAVKLADINDNMDLKRIASPTKTDHERVKKYVRARAILEGLES